MTFFNLDKLNEDCLAWLERTGNGKKHNTTKKIPAEVFVLEKQHLRPVLGKIDIGCTNSITRQVRKDNTVWYDGNRYSVPLGTYDGKGKEVKVEVVDDKILVICDKETGQELARHTLSHEKGKLIKNNNHRRDRSKGIDQYIDSVAALFPAPSRARGFLEEIRVQKPRYIRDQLQLIQQNIISVDKQVIAGALDFCLKHKLFAATDFVDAVKYFEEQNISIKSAYEKDLSKPKPLVDIERSKLKTKPQVRDIRIYQEIMKGGLVCQEQSPN